MYNDEDHDGEYDALVTRAAEYQRTLEPVLSSPTSSSRNTNHLPKARSKNRLAAAYRLMGLENKVKYSKIDIILP